MDEEMLDPKTIRDFGILKNASKRLVRKGVDERLIVSLVKKAMWEEWTERKRNPSVSRETAKRILKHA